LQTKKRVARAAEDVLSTKINRNKNTSSRNKSLLFYISNCKLTSPKNETLSPEFLLLNLFRGLELIEAHIHFSCLDQLLLNLSTMDDLNDAIGSNNQQNTIVSTITTVTGNGANVTRISSQTIDDYEPDPKWEITTLEKASYDCEDMYIDTLPNQHEPESSSDTVQQPTHLSADDEESSQTVEHDRRTEEQPERELSPTKLIEDDSLSAPPTVGNNIELHSMMNAEPEAFEEAPSEEEKTQLEDVTENAAVTADDTTNTFSHNEGGDQESTHSEASPNQIETSQDSKIRDNHQTPTTDSGADPAHRQDETAFNTCLLSQSSVDAQMEKVIDNIVELGGCQQFAHSLEQTESIVDEEKEVEHIQREIGGERNSVVDTTEANVYEKLDELIPEPESTNLDAPEERPQRSHDLKEELKESESKATSSISESKRTDPTDSEEQALPGVDQILDDAPLSPQVEPVDNPKEQPPVESETQEAQKAEEKISVPKDLRDEVVEEKDADLQAKEIQENDESTPDQLNSVENKEQEKPVNIESPPKEEEVSEEKRIQVEMIESKIETRRRISKRAKVALQAKERKEEKIDGGGESVQIEHKPQPEDEDVVGDESEQVPMLDRVTKVSIPLTRTSRALRRPVEQEPPLVRSERKPSKRSLGRIETEDTKNEPVIKAKKTSRPALSRATISTSAPSVKPDKHRSTDTSFTDESTSKKYSCERCKYSTDRLNNIVYHKKTSCEFTIKNFSDQVEQWKQKLQSPKSNNKRSSR